jgi:uncharacterized protein
MRIAIAGGSGFIGSALAASLRSSGHAVHVISRRERRYSTDIQWNPTRGGLDPRALDGVDGVVNLTGRPIATRWTRSAKQEIRDSRVATTKLLARTLASLDRPPAVLLSGSAIGIYGDRGDEQIDERSSLGDDFPARLGIEWEEAARPAIDAGIRVAHMRMGLALARGGGMLAPLLLPFRLGLGGRIGRGDQWLSWIALDDATRALEFLLVEATASGPYNITAPNPVQSREFAAALGRALGRPAVIPTPAPALRLLFGREMADAMLLGGQRVLPSRLLEAGFTFEHPRLDDALRRALGS